MPSRLDLLSAIVILTLISVLPIHGRRLRHHGEEVRLIEENPLLLNNNNTTTTIPNPNLNPNMIIGSPPCIPISGKTALIIGEDYDSIKNYTQAFPSHSQPFGLMSYTALSNDYGHLTGLQQPIDYGSGIQWVEGLTSLYPTSAIQLGLWIKGQLDGIVHGEYDNEIQTLANYMNETSAHVFYLRIGYEFDSLENNYDNKSYQLAYQYIVKKFHEKEITNVHFVWHGSGFKPRDNMNYQDWFPGKEYVDWCGVSLFQQPYECSTSSYCVMEYPQKLADFCSSLNIPLMIAESTPFGGIVEDKTVRGNPDVVNEAGFKGSTWSIWFLPVFHFIATNNVRIWCYINSNWDAFPMWAEKHEKGVEWGDSRLEAFDEIKERWTKIVLSSHRSMKTYQLVDDSGDDDGSEETSLCENIPLPKTKPSTSNSTTNNTSPSNQHKHHRPSLEEELEIGVKDIVIMLLEFTEIVLILGFVLTCFILIVNCCHKVYQSQQGYTIIQ